MGLYKLFSCNVEIQYKSCLISKAMFFTILTTISTIVLPFIVAYRSRGFWLKSSSFFEQPKVHFTYEYLLLLETEDPSQSIVCGETVIVDEYSGGEQENCAEVQIQEYDYNGDARNDLLDFRFKVIVPTDHTITSILLFLALDYQLKTVCPLHMQSLAVIDKEFAIPPSGFSYFGDLQFHQTSHLPCVWNLLDDRFNTSLLSTPIDDKVNNIDYILARYYRRAVKTRTEKMFSRSQNGHTGVMDIRINLQIPENKILYTPSLMQELKWAWPQYLSILVIFYWIFDKIKRFVFNKRLLMAWEIVPWKK